MERVLDNVNDTLNAYYKMNTQVGNEKQTSLKQIKNMMSEKWSELCDSWIPKYVEECPNIDKCYKEEFTSFYTPSIEKEVNTSVEYVESSKEIETLDVPQKRL